MLIVTFVNLDQTFQVVSDTASSTLPAGDFHSKSLPANPEFCGSYSELSTRNVEREKVVRSKVGSYICTADFICSTAVLVVLHRGTAEEEHPANLQHAELSW